MYGFDAARDNFASSDTWETWAMSTFADVDYGHGQYHMPLVLTGSFADSDYGDGTELPPVETGSFGDVDYA